MNLETINTDLQDLQTILSKIGKVAGYVKVFNVEDDFTSDLKNEFSNELKAAKGIWVEFEILPNSSLFIVNDIMGFINDNCDSNCEIIFGTAINEDLVENSIKCKILFTGLV
jgi:cell division GTPase FtsZ